MKREEQSRLMLEKITASAILEFNQSGYEMASMNHICANGQISKGIIYHYFKDKDALYLHCIKCCYDTLAEYYETFVYHGSSFEASISEYLHVRVNFFREHSEYRGLFFHALLRTPEHLKADVERLRSRIDALNASFYETLLSKVVLREEITLKKAVGYMEILNHAFNDYFRKEAMSNQDFKEVVDQHEAMIPEWIDIFLHGIVKEDD